jgi:tetratricopeptide (TPR) repeat protein
VNLHSISFYLLSLMLCTIPTQFAQGDSSPVWQQSVNEKLGGYRQRIDELESIGGAYSPELTEALSDYGHALRAQGKYEEAVALFKRGAHLARINEGLHNAAQIPLVRGEIASLFDAGNYDAIDQRQQYLLTVELKSLKDAGALANALMQQANWQQTAFKLNLGEQPALRLENMYNLYQHALTQLATEKGMNSTALIPALQGLLTTHYLIADFDYTHPLEATNIDTFENRKQYNYAASVKSDNYKRGEQIITTLHNVRMEQLDEGETDPDTTATLVMLGDWHLYHGRRDAAFEVYLTAFQELVETDDAKTNIPELFDNPVALPDVDGIRSLTPASTPNEEAIVIEFGVDSRGRAFDIKRLDTNEALDSKAKRLKRELHQTRFRPRIEAGKAVETTQIVQAFNIL